METVVGIGPQTVERQRRVLDSSEKDRTDPMSGRMHVARRRIERIIQPRAATEGATRRARTNSKVSSAIQRSGEAVAARNRDGRECRRPESEIASGANVRACAQSRRFVAEFSAIKDDAHRSDAREIDCR